MSKRRDEMSPEELEEVRRRDREEQKRWRDANPERSREIARQSRERAIARDAEGFRRVQKERYARYIAKPGSREKHRARSVARYAAGLTRRRGLTIAERHEYWVHQGGRCDFCGKPYPDPAQPGAWRHSVVDHDDSHCASSIGCLGCVRAQGHRPCNVAEGQIRRAMAEGIIDGFTGRLVTVLETRPMQQWVLATERGAH